MALNWIATVRASTMAMAVGALVSGCGGGAASDAQTATSATGTNAVTDSSTSGDTAPTQAGTTSTVSGDTTAQAPGAADTSATSTDEATASTSTDADDPIVVAAASTSITPASSTAAASTAPARSGAALNVGGLDYFAAELPTIDVMKRAGAWLTQCGGSSCSGFATAGASSWDTLEESALDLDANGWIRSLPAASDTTHKYRSVATMLSASGALPLGRYIVRYDGAGSITYSGATRYSSSTGRDVVDITSTGNVWMTITATTSGNYLRNIRVYLPGGACANDLTVYAASASACTSATGAYVPFESFPSTQTWNPQFLQDLKGFRALRFLDWGHTNTSPAKTWADRTSPTARTWTGPTGAPLEAMLDLANAIQADAWINVPTYVNDDYAAQLGKLAAAHLTGVSKLDLEYSNEPWNYAFGTSTWMLNQAKAKWPALVASGTSPYTLQDSWYGERASQVCAAAKAVYPATKCVVNGQAANSWIANQVLTCPFAAAELGHRCGSNIDVLAIAPYFGQYVASSSLRPTVSTWYADADGGLGKLFQEITGLDASGKPVAVPLYAAGSNVPGGALAQIRGWITANKAVADSFNIPLWAYEGGQHLVPASGDTDASLIALFIAANRDPRMGAVYDTMMANWQALGGQTFAYYSHVSAPSKYGMWGLKESMGDNSNAKWKSALRARASNCAWSGC